MRRVAQRRSDKPGQSKFEAKKKIIKEAVFTALIYSPADAQTHAECDEHKEAMRQAKQKSAEPKPRVAVSGGVHDIEGEPPEVVHQLLVIMGGIGKNVKSMAEENTFPTVVARLTSLEKKMGRLIEQVAAISLKVPVDEVGSGGGRR